MNDPTDIRRRYRQFAERECQGYSDVYHGLALAVWKDDEVVGFLAGLPVAQPNLFFTSLQLLTGPDRMPATGAELRVLLKRRGGELAGVMRSHRTRGRADFVTSPDPSMPTAPADRA